MKSFLRYLLAGFVSALASVSAWAGTSTGSGNILIAPQLAVASDGPITATFLGADTSLFVGVEAITAPSNLDSFFFGIPPVPGAQAQTGTSFSAGTSITLGSFFAVANSDGDHVLSSTAFDSAINRQQVANLLPVEAILLNAGVIPTGPDRLLVGFNPLGAAQPSGFGGFAVRISVSNVCVR